MYDAIIDKMNYSVIKRKFDFKEGRKEIVLDRLLYIESNLHRLEFHVMEDDETVYTMYKILNVMDDMLSENGFIRTHQSHLVNVKCIKNVARYKVILTNGVELPIPKARYTEVKKKFIVCQGEV